MSERLNNQQGTPAARAAWKKHLGKWKLFAAAGGATMAAGTDADADIVYSGVINHAITLNGGAQSFGLAGVRGGFKASANTQKAYMSGKLDILTKVTSLWNATAFLGVNRYAKGAPIGTAQLHNMNNRPVAQASTGGGTNPIGQFNPPRNSTATGYAGFQSQGHLGWIHLNLTRGSNGLTGFTIIDWAYNDVVGGGINAGQMPAAAVPEPGTMAMGLLASGAAGLVALRRAKARAADAATGAEPAVA